MADAGDVELQERIKKRGGDKLPQGSFEGPVSVNRGCTDILCILLFGLFWAGMIAVASFAFSNGRPYRLWRGYDFDGIVCGEGVNAGKTKLYYPKPPNFQYAVCLPSCPPEASVILCAKSVYSNGTNTGSYCPDTLALSSTSGISVASLTQVSDCLKNFTTLLYNPGASNIPLAYCFPTYPSGAWNIRDDYGRCMPFAKGNTSASSILQSIPTGNGNQTIPADFSYTDLSDVASNPGLALTVMITHVTSNYVYILISAAVALVVSIIYTQILRFLAGVITWLTLFLFEILLIALAVLFLWKAGIMDPSMLPASVQTELTKIGVQNSVVWNLKATEDEQKIVLAIGIVCAVCAVLGLLFLCIMCSRINMAIKVIKEASKAISALPAILLLPIVMWFGILCLFVWWVIVLFYLFSAGTFNSTSHAYELDTNLRRVAIYHLFGLFWTRSFILALGDITMAGAVGHWYWKREMLEATTLRSFLRTLRYHIGTAAFGSFIIALIETIRMIVRYYTSKMKDLEKNSKIVYAIRSCTECCLACLERFLKFASRQAYIQCAIHGTGFCRSAVSAFQLLLRNSLRLAAITVVGHIFIGLGKVFIATLTALIGALLIIRATGGSFSDVTSADPLSVLIIFVLGFAVATAFMSVYETVIDTLFQCFCEESEINPAGAQKAGPEFRKMVDDHSAGAADQH